MLFAFQGGILKEFRKNQNPFNFLWCWSLGALAGALQVLVQAKKAQTEILKKGISQKHPLNIHASLYVQLCDNNSQTSGDRQINKPYTEHLQSFTDRLRTI